MQVALADTQQQLASQRDLQSRAARRADRPDHADSVSPQKLSALQQSMHEMHAEIAELKSTLYQKNAELDSLHRSEQPNFVLHGASHDWQSEDGALRLRHRIRVVSICKLTNSTFA